MNHEDDPHFNIFVCYKDMCLEVKDLVLNSM